MIEYIKKFESAAAGDNYSIADIPFMTSVETSGQNLVCNETGKKLVNVLGVLEIQSAGPEMVDLGLTSGILWAKTNIGAQTETDYGQYFAWGETAQHEGWPEDKSSHPYDWNEYRYGSASPFSKYDTDGKTVLEPTDDAATVILGAGYRMPTQAEFKELVHETDNEWTTIDGVNGWKFTNKSDSSKYIFLPAAGFCIDSDLDGVGYECDYWSSSLVGIQHTAAFCMYFTNDEEWSTDGVDRLYGFSIRPVCSANS